MSNRMRRGLLGLVGIGLCTLFCGRAMAGSHTWDVHEVFSNASGSIQFIELKECCGGCCETFVPGHQITSIALGNSFVIPPPNLAQPTGFRHLLLATPAFAAQSGAPMPDYVFPAGSVPFFSNSANETVAYTPWDTFAFAAGVLPTDGIHSIEVVNHLTDQFVVGCNSPTNYAGQTGSINATCILQGDVNRDGVLNGLDVSAFVRAKLGLSQPGEIPACAEYCTGSLAGDVAAFASDLLN